MNSIAMNACEYMWLNMQSRNQVLDPKDFTWIFKISQFSEENIYALWCSWRVELPFIRGRKISQTTKSLVERPWYSFRLRTEASQPTKCDSWTLGLSVKANTANRTALDNGFRYCCRWTLIILNWLLVLLKLFSFMQKMHKDFLRTVWWRWGASWRVTTARRMDPWILPARPMVMRYLVMPRPRPSCVKDFATLHLFAQQSKSNKP